MKNIITALNNPELNILLQKEKNVNIINKDIIYKEGILEILELKKEINLIIINYELPGNIEIEKLIEKIKKINEKIEFIFILEKENPEKEKILKKYNIDNIYYNNKIDKMQLIKIIIQKNKTNEEKLKQEIEKLKKIIKEKDVQHKKINYIKKIYNKDIKKQSQKIFEKNENVNNKQNKDEKIKNAVVIEENCNEEKDTLAIKILNLIKNKNMKILLVDLKINNEDMHIMFNKKNAIKQIHNKIKKTNQIQERNLQINKKNSNNMEKVFFIKINDNIKLLTGLKYILKNNNEEKEIKKIVNIIKRSSKKYNYLIIETLDKGNEKLNRKIMEIIEKNILIFSNNLVDIKKTKEKIKEYKKINNIKIYLFLKQSKEYIKIDKGIIKEIFKKIKIIKKTNLYLKKEILKI